MIITVTSISTKFLHKINTIGQFDDYLAVVFLNWIVRKKL